MESALQKEVEMSVIKLAQAYPDKSLVLELAWNESFTFFQPARREWNTFYIVVLFSAS